MGRLEHGVPCLNTIIFAVIIFFHWFTCQTNQLMLISYRHLFLQLRRIERWRKLVLVLERRLWRHNVRGLGNLLLHWLTCVSKFRYLHYMLLPRCRPCVANLTELCLITLNSLTDPTANPVRPKFLRCLHIIQILLTVYFWKACHAVCIWHCVDDLMAQSFSIFFHSRRLGLRKSILGAWFRCDGSAQLVGFVIGINLLWFKMLNYIVSLNTYSWFVNICRHLLVYLMVT